MSENANIPMYKNIANYRIFAARETAYNKIDGVRVGDYIRHKDGTVSRATYLWDFPDMSPSVQDGGGSASFYLGDGYISYSGGLNQSIDISTLRQTAELKDGVIWFFKNGFQSCGNGIDYRMKFRVFQEV